MASSQQPPPLHRHQSSLEGVIDFAAQPPLSTDQRGQATRIFYQIVQHFEAAIDRRIGEYNRPALVRLTYEYARSRESQDTFLRAFFRHTALSMNEDLDFSNKDLELDTRSALVGFAEYLFEDFFLPLKASTRKTPQPTPAIHSAVQMVQGGSQSFSGTRDRVSALRGTCLIRDRHRCVISRKFDQAETIVRYTRNGDDAQDDDGVLLNDETNGFDLLEVAHILPHSLTKANADFQLDTSRNAALEVLNMFDTGVVHLIDGLNIDRPYNAMTLTSNLHALFGDFRIFFDPIPDQAHTYRINSFLPPGLRRMHNLPVTRTLPLSENRTIDPPSPRLLAIHNAIAHILHLSAAGEYIDKIFRDMEQNGVREDGSTELGHFVNLGLHGWLNGAVDTY